MSKKIALVTGAMGGLGTAICQSLAKDGFKVVANCLPNFELKDAWLSAQRDLGFDFAAAEGDVSNYESCAAMVAKIEADVGPIDVLVNNAGITRDKFFPKMEKGQWDAVINTNLNSLFNVTHHVSAKMAERGWVASSTSRRSTASRARPARPTTRLPRPVCWASRRRLPASSPPRA